MSTDPEFVIKAADVIGLYLGPPTNALVLSVGFQQVLPTNLFALANESTRKLLTIVRARQRAFSYYLMHCLITGQELKA